MDQNIEQEAFQHFFTDERKKIIIIASNGYQLQGCKPLQNKEFDLSPYDVEKSQNIEFYQYVDGEEVALIKEKDQYYQLKNQKKIPFSPQTKQKEVEALVQKINENLSEGQQKQNTPRLHCIITDYASKFQYFGTKTEDEFFSETKTHQEIFDIFEIIKDHIGTALKNENDGTYVKFDQVNSQFILCQQISISKNKTKKIESKVELKPMQMENESQNVEFEIALSDCIQKIETIKGQISELDQQNKQQQTNNKKIKELEVSIVQIKNLEAKVKSLEQTIKNQQDDTKKLSQKVSQIENNFEDVNSTFENLGNELNKDTIQGIQNKILELEEQLNQPQNQMRRTQPISDSNSRQLETRLQNKIAQLEQRITNVEQNQQKQQQIKKSNSNIEILKISSLQKDGYDLEGFCYKVSDLYQGGLSRLELKVSDEDESFEIGIVKNGDPEKIKLTANSYRFEFPDGSAGRGEKRQKLISYYPMVGAQIGLEVNTAQSLVTVYINGVKNFSMNLTSMFQEFSYYVKVGANVELGDVFEMEDQTYLEY